MMFLFFELQSMFGPTPKDDPESSHWPLPGRRMFLIRLRRAVSETWLIGLDLDAADSLSSPVRAGVLSTMAMGRLVSSQV